MMPGGGGYEIIRNLQMDAATRPVPVIIMTGSHLDSSTKSMMQQEPNLAGYFEKPVRPEVVVKKIHQLLNTLNRDEQRKLMNPDVPGKFNDGF
jgi:CheY-like chemotaxis protein